MRTQQWKNRPGLISKELRLQGDELLVDEEVADCLKSCRHQIDDGDELVIEFVSTGYYDQGVVSGPPERCHPPECEDERTITSVYIQKRDKCVFLNAEELEDFFDDDIYKAEIDIDED
jgi:hypothetical protein